MILRALSGLFLLFFSSIYATGATYDLKGPRDVTVSVTTEGSAYRVEVSFVGITAFDGARNKSVNRIKAERYAIAGLAREVKAGPGQSLELQEFSTIRSNWNGKRYSARFVVPVAGVKVVPTEATRASKSGVSTVAALPWTPTTIPDRKADAIETIGAIARSLESDVPPLGHPTFDDSIFDWKAESKRSLDSLEDYVARELRLRMEVEEVVQGTISPIRRKLDLMAQEHERLRENLKELTQACRDGLPDLRPGLTASNETQSTGEAKCVQALREANAAEKQNARLSALQIEQFEEEVAAIESEYEDARESLVSLGQRLNDVQADCIDSLPDSNLNTDAFYEAIAQVEEECMGRFESIREQPFPTMGLATVQMAIVAEAITARKADVVAALAEHVKSAENP